MKAMLGRWDSLVLGEEQARRIIADGRASTEEVDAEVASNEQNNDDHTDDAEDTHAALIALRGELQD